MSEIETSAVDRAAIALRMSGHHTKAILVQALAAERDALAARVALAEGMAEAKREGMEGLTPKFIETIDAAARHARNVGWFQSADDIAQAAVFLRAASGGRDGER